MVALRNRWPVPPKIIATQGLEKCEGPSYRLEMLSRPSMSVLECSTMFWMRPLFFFRFSISRSDSSSVGNPRSLLLSSGFPPLSYLCLYLCSCSDISLELFFTVPPLSRAPFCHLCCSSSLMTALTTALLPLLSQPPPLLRRISHVRLSMHMHVCVCVCVCVCMLLMIQTLAY
jgi:hypothetical protein